jgi:phenylpropionate dioxygenase-like ring-hydroxylating dioxygenase large terminal subunit
LIQDSVLVNDWHALARSEDITEKEIFASRLLGEDLVLWRSQDKLLAWKDLCVHRGTRLSLGSIEDAKLVCAYHGWTYDSSGRCVSIPAHPEQKPPEKARVTSYRVMEAYGLVWGSLGSPKDSFAPSFPEWNDKNFRKILCGPYHYNASGTRAIENALDIAHFPYVHEGLLGDKAHPEIKDYEVQTTNEGLVAKEIEVWQPNPEGTGEGAYVKYTYRVMRPLTMYFTKVNGQKRFSIFFTVCPVEETKSIAWLWLAMNYGMEIPESELRSFQDKVTSQDIPIVESQRPELLPLDLQAELHLRSDRTSIAYRKWLKQLGLSFGTS